MRGELKIYIVDDHPIFRKGLAQLVNEEPDMCVAGEAEEVKEAKNAILLLKPDIAVIDITLKNRSGLELIHELKTCMPELPVLVVSMHEESLYAERVIRAGAMGYIMKQEMTTSVISAIRQVVSGRIYASEAMTNKLLGRLTDKNKSGKNNITDQLTDRELEVFRLIAKGYGRKQMSDVLGVSTKTIGSYRENIKRKLSLGNSHELVKSAIEWAMSVNQ
jgi:DNA-binding NarL/FixJ family response regulator